MTRTEEYAYLALKGAVNSPEKQGEISQTLKGVGIEVSEADARLIANFIERHGYGQCMAISRGRLLLYPNMEGEDFVREKDHVPFSQKLDRVYRALERQPNKSAGLEELLSALRIDYQSWDLKEYEAEFERTGYVKVLQKSKDGIVVGLTQKGADYLHSPPWERVSVPQEVKPDVMAVLEQMIAAVRESVQFSAQANQQILLLFAEFMDEVSKGNYTPTKAEKVLQTADQLSSIGSLAVALRGLLGGG